MRILVTGSNGMLGSDLVHELSSIHEVFGLGARSNRHSHIQYTQADLSNASEILKAVSTVKPAIIIHTAAYTDVDGCELNPNLAYSVNTKGTQYLTNVCNQQGAVLFYISTDYVFDGQKKAPYTENDLPNPVSVYGKSKLQAEEYIKSNAQSAWIIRSSWLFGKTGKNFLRTMLNLFVSSQTIQVVDDQIGAPTYTYDLAHAISQMIEKTNRIQGHRIYHLANQGLTSWYDVALRLREKTQARVLIERIKSAELKRAARRPMNSIFNMDRIKNDFGIQMRPWEAAVDEFWDDCLFHEWNHLISQKTRV